jgi:hypothetical protein
MLMSSLDLWSVLRPPPGLPPSGLGVLLFNRGIRTNRECARPLQAPRRGSSPDLELSLVMVKSKHLFFTNAIPVKTFSHQSFFQRHTRFKGMERDDLEEAITCGKNFERLPCAEALLTSP